MTGAKPEAGTGPGEHAPLGPSSAHRWMTCPGSVAASAGVPAPPSSPAAEEGTAAHTLAELCLRKRLGLHRDVEAGMLEWQSRYGGTYDIGTMIHDVEPYVDRVVELYEDSRASDPTTTVELERRVWGDDVDVYGTADAVVVGDGTVHVVDLKYGRGVRVEAVGNPQLRIYALGAMRDAELIAPVERVTATIVQPRLDHVSTETLTAADLDDWATRVLRPAVEAVRADDAPRIPDDDACRWCPAAPVCPERVAVVAAAAGLTVELDGDPTPPDLLTPTDLAALLPQLDAIKTWIRAVEAYALRLAGDGGLPGYTVGASAPRRAMTMEAVDALVAAGVADRDELVRESPVTLGRAERIAGGRRALDELCGDRLDLRPGSPRLVREDS